VLDRTTSRNKKKASRVAKKSGMSPDQIAYEAHRKALDAPPSPPLRSSHASQYSTIKTPKLLEAFLIYLRKGYVPKRAAEAVGISRNTAFKWRQKDPEFAAAWEEAVDEGTDLLEEAILKRARDGYDRPIFQGGVFVGQERVYSDSLAAMMLQGRRPQYRRQQHDMNVNVIGNVNHSHSIDFSSLTVSELDELQRQYSEALDLVTEVQPVRAIESSGAGEEPS
jgi:hypothetical protein